MDWAAALAAEVGASDSALRRCTYSGRPFGDARFVEALSQRFGRRWEPGPLSWMATTATSCFCYRAVLLIDATRQQFIRAAANPWLRPISITPVPEPATCTTALRGAVYYFKAMRSIVFFFPASIPPENGAIPPVTFWAALISCSALLVFGQP